MSNNSGIFDNLNHLSTTKEQIKTVLRAKNVEVPTNAGFSFFAGSVGSMCHYSILTIYNWSSTNLSFNYIGVDSSNNITRLQKELPAKTSTTIDNIVELMQTYFVTGISLSEIKYTVKVFDADTGEFLRDKTVSLRDKIGTHTYGVGSYAVTSFINTNSARYDDFSPLNQPNLYISLG